MKSLKYLKVAAISSFVTIMFTRVLTELDFSPIVSYGVAFVLGVLAGLISNTSKK